MKKRVLSILVVALMLTMSLAGCGSNTDNTELEKVSFVLDWTPNTKGIRIRDKLFLEYGERFSWPDKDADIKNDDVFCYGLKDHFGILSDGTVVPCCLDCDGVINLGNIFKEDISDILNSDRAKKMVEGFNNRKVSEDLCQKCGYAQRF